MKAAKLAPDAVLLPVDFDAYRHYSRLFKAAVSTICPLIEDRGIDEIYIDLSDHPEATLPLAQSIKQAVVDATGLSCSIGIAPNKLLAKICSELDKPDGITIIGMDDIATRIWPLAVKKINGIGPKANAKLAALGINTIAELALADADLLQTNFGRTYAIWLQQVSHGYDERPVSNRTEPKSLSRETTFERDLHAVQDREILGGIFTRLCTALAADLVRKAYVSKTIGIKLRYDDFRTVTRDLTLPSPTADAAVIRRAAAECIRRVALDRRLRLLGVRASALTKADSIPPEEQASQGELGF